MNTAGVLFRREQVRGYSQYFGGVEKASNNVFLVNLKVEYVQQYRCGRKRALLLIDFHSGEKSFKDFIVRAWTYKDLLHVG
jgi:hypothetical protein